MKKTIISGLVAGAFALTLAGCGNSGTTNTVNSEAAANLEKTNFNVGYLNSTAHLLAFVAQEEGFFQEEGLNVTLTQFSNSAELTTGLESGKLDVSLIGSVPTITFQSQGHDISIFGRRQGRFKHLTDDDIELVKQSRDRKWEFINKNFKTTG